MRNIESADAGFVGARSHIFRQQTQKGTNAGCMILITDK